MDGATVPGVVEVHVSRPGQLGYKKNGDFISVMLAT